MSQMTLVLGFVGAGHIYHSIIIKKCFTTGADLERKIVNKIFFFIVSTPMTF